MKIVEDGAQAVADMRDRQSRLEQRLTELEDREAIRQLIYWKARATDRADPAAERRALDVAGKYMGKTPDERANDLRENWAFSHHHIGNILIELDGDDARTETYATAFHRTRPNRDSNEYTIGRRCLDRLGLDDGAAHDVIVGLRYIERFRKTDGRWKIVERRHVFDWSRVCVPSELIDSGLYERARPGHSDRRPDDHSYSPNAIGVPDLAIAIDD